MKNSSINVAEIPKDQSDQFLDPSEQHLWIKLNFTPDPELSSLFVRSEFL